MAPAKKKATTVPDIEDLAGVKKKFNEQYPLIREQRSRTPAAVDSMGCSSVENRGVEPNVHRFQTFVGILISPRTTDVNTIKAVRALLDFGLNISKMLDTPVEEIAQLIKNVGFYKQKAGYIKDSAQIFRDRFNDDVPDNLEDLMALRGVGLKIATLTLVHCYDSQDHIGVDVHVHRICNRLWIDTKTPEKTEEVLKQIAPRELWREVNGVLVGFGQTICKAKPLCNQCCINDTCPVAPTYLKEANAKAAAKQKKGKAATKKTQAEPVYKKRRTLPSSDENSSQEEISEQSDTAEEESSVDEASSEEEPASSSKVLKESNGTKGSQKSGRKQGINPSSSVKTTKKKA